MFKVTSPDVNTLGARVAVAMLYHNGRKEILSEMLNAIASQEYNKNNVYLILMDNLSSDGSSEIVNEFLAKNEKLYYKVDHKHEAGNVPHLRNICLDLAISNACDYLFFVDSDVLITQDSITRLLCLFDSSDVFITSLPYYVPINKENLFSKIRLKYDKNMAKSSVSEVCEVKSIGMGATMINLSLVPKVGFFDEKIPYIEDLNYTRRAWLMGYRIILDHRISLVHKKSVNTWHFLRFTLTKMGKSEVLNIRANNLWKQEVRGLSYWLLLLLSIPLIVISPIPFLILFISGWIIYSIRMKGLGKLVAFPLLAIYRESRTLSMLYWVLQYWRLQAISS